MNLRHVTQDELKNELEIREILAFTATITERKNTITITRVNRRKAVINVNGHKTTIKKTRPCQGVSKESNTHKLYFSVAPVSRF